MEAIEQFSAILSTVVQADRCFSAQSPKYDCLMKVEFWLDLLFQYCVILPFKGKTTQTCHVIITL